MKVRAAGPNKWEVFQTVPDSTGYSHAPTRDEVVLTLTDTDLASVLNSLADIDKAGGSITTLMHAHDAMVAAAATVATRMPGAAGPIHLVSTAVPEAHDALLHDLATGEGMPEPAGHIPGVV